MVSSPEQPVAGIPLLATKLYIPKWRPGLVSRPSLVERLRHGTERNLTLISAPAGFGKTTLLAEWLASTPSADRAVAWVSLDESDNDPALFWSYVITALQGVRSDVGKRALPLLQSPQPPPIASVLTTLINEIAVTANDVALVLDDVHVIDAQLVHEAIAFLLDHLPPQLRLVITTREDPPLPLSRLRARGQLTELRAADLRFTPDEAAAFLNEVMDLNLRAADVVSLETRTEGWIAGLQLAALSLRGRHDVPGFIQSFAGDDRYIVDYLVEEVLQRQPERVRSFLLQTSMLDRLSGSLCDAVTGGNDGARLLETLERGNLFVVPLDDKRRWYRYHHLFADVLRAHAMEEQPELEPTLRRRAAAWFEEHGMPAEAIEQSRAAADHEALARLLVANIEEFERGGRYGSISRWSESLPAEMVQARPRLALICATSALRTAPNLQAVRRFTSMAEDAIELIEAAGGLDPVNDVNGTVVGSEGLDALKGEALALRLTHSARTLPPDEVARIAGRALELVPQSKQHVRGIIQMILAGSQGKRGDLNVELSNLDRGVDEARRTQNPSLLECMLEQRGQVYVSMGRLGDGRRSFEGAIAARGDFSAEANWVICGPHAWLAEVMLELGDLAAATDHVSRALEFAHGSPMRSYVLYARAIAALVLLAAGDTRAAMEQLEGAHAFARGVRNFRYSSFLSSVNLGFYCQMGDMDAAADVARDRGLSPNVAIDGENEAEITAYARYLITRGDAGDAQHVLARVLPIARGAGRVHHEIHALALQALAYERLSERARALEALGRATRLGEPGRYNRTFTGEGPVMSGLLGALTDAVQRGRGPREAGSPSYLASLLRAAGLTVEPAAAQPAPGALAEPLTRREIETLRLIAAGMRNQEIADELFISLSTVKRHIANAYGKLGVSHRTEALARANELNLL